VSEDNGPVCPECGTPRAADGTPACVCARRASDAHRNTRTAEAAAAEDFDPVRIRPFVELDAPSGPAEPDEAQVTGKAGELTGSGSADAAAASVPAVAAPPVEGDEALGQEAGPREDIRRRRRTLLITGAGAALAVLATGAFLGGLFSYDSPARYGDRSDGVRAPVPDDPADDDMSPATSSPSASSTQPSESPSPPTSTTPTGPPATPDGSADPTGAPSDSAPSPTGTARPGAPGQQDPVLRFGDRGPEVTELQLRLRQTGFYGGDIDGDFDGEVENAVRGYQLTRVVLADESGVYGRATRTSLESETSPP
jgi:hypothetical protein